MAEGTNTWLGGAVPINPSTGFEIIQATAAGGADLVTLTLGASATDDFLVCQQGGTERFVVQDGGNAVMTLAHAGTSALEGLAITLTDATTYSTGYGAAVYLHVTQSGAKTGNANTSQFNAYALDLTISAAAPYINGSYIYIAQSGSPDLSSALVYGETIYIEELGATSVLVGISIEKANTTKATGYDTFIKMSCQGSGVAESAIQFTGTHNPDYFLKFQSTADFIGADTSNLPAAATYKLKCQAGATDFYLIGVADF